MIKNLILTKIIFLSIFTENIFALDKDDKLENIPVLFPSPSINSLEEIKFKITEHCIIHHINRDLYNNIKNFTKKLEVLKENRLFKDMGLNPNSAVKFEVIPFINSIKSTRPHYEFLMDINTKIKNIEEVNTLLNRSFTTKKMMDTFIQSIHETFLLYNATFNSNLNYSNQDFNTKYLPKLLEIYEFLENHKEIIDNLQREQKSFYMMLLNFQNLDVTKNYFLNIEAANKSTFKAHLKTDINELLIEIRSFFEKYKNLSEKK